MKATFHGSGNSHDSRVYFHRFWMALERISTTFDALATGLMLYFVHGYSGSGPDLEHAHVLWLTGLSLGRLSNNPVTGH